MKFPLRRLLPVLVLIPVLGLTACKGSFPQFTANASCNSNGGCSANYSQAPKAHASAPKADPSSAPQSTPATAVTVPPGQDQPDPAVTVTVTPAPLPQPAVTVTTTSTAGAYADWGTCLPDPSRYDMEMLATAVVSDYSAQLAQCLQIPQGNFTVFLEQLNTYAMIGYRSGLFDSRQGRQDWALGSPEVQCPDERMIYSLYQIYMQYRGVA